MERVLSYEEALMEVLDVAASLAIELSAERIDLLDARNRVLAEPIRADRDQPPFTRCTRDGFAVRSGDVEGDSRGSLHLRGLVRAGEVWRGAPLAEGETVEIMTGAPLPEGADAVLMVEHTTSAASGDVLPAAGRRLRAGENVVARGAEAAEGAEVVPAGRVVRAPEIALAANCGSRQVLAYRRPRVAIVATGDELVELDRTPEPWQIRNSNSHALAALVEEEGGEPQRLPIARDTRDDLRERLAEARNSDLLLLSGGVSMGKYDLVEDALREAGAEFLFTGARIQPGKPIVFGRLPRHKSTAGEASGRAGEASGRAGEASGRAGEASGMADGWFPFFGLPGNPISTEVCFRLFVAPLLRALAGQTELPPRFAEARLSEEVGGGAAVLRFLPAVIAGDWTGVRVRPVPWQGSGDLAANGRANGFVVLPVGVGPLRAGDTVRVLLR